MKRNKKGESLLINFEETKYIREKGNMTFNDYIFLFERSIQLTEINQEKLKFESERSLVKNGNFSKLYSKSFEVLENSRQDYENIKKIVNSLTVDERKSMDPIEFLTEDRFWEISNDIDLEIVTIRKIIQEYKRARNLVFRKVNTVQFKRNRK